MVAMVRVGSGMDMAALEPDMVEGRSLDILAGLELVVYNPVVDRGTALVAGQRDILTQVVVDSGLLED